MADDKRMREALTLAQRALNAAPRFRVGDTDSYRIAALVDQALAEPVPEPSPPLPSPGGKDGLSFPQIRSILAERRQIAILWTVDDVQAVRPDLDEDQAWKVLQRVEQGHDGGYGVTFDTIESASRERFPDPDTPRSPSGIGAQARGGVQDNGNGPVPGDARVPYRSPAEIAAAATARPDVPGHGHANDNGIER